MANFKDSGEVSPELRFVQFLRGLEASRDRGALAVLRRVLGRDAPSAEALRRIVPHLPPEERKHRWYFLVAGLFASHPATGGAGNMGDAFRHLGEHDSAQKRFAALLDSDARDLPHRLRQAVSLAKAKPVPIDWLRLLNDLLHWEHEARYVQQRWAQAYWRHGSSAEAKNEVTGVFAGGVAKGVQ
jgi:CRISPR system Cascade subunit CasB